MKIMTVRMARRLASLAALALMLVTLVPHTAAAQGFFYEEVKKDGRIYVFNNMKDYDAFSRGGEMGKSITRIGVGPNGETMVFDSEEAIHLYHFKHDMPGEVIVKSETPAPVQKFSWKDGKTTFETDNAALTISNRIQVRYTVEDFDDDAKDTKGSFRIRRAKTKLEGWAYWRKFTYELQLNWPDTANPLEDANGNVDFRGDKLVQLKFGQFKVPFGRQELTSSGNQQFVDRSIVSSEFAKGRDAGVQVWGQTKDAKIEYRGGIFNGNGRTQSSNDNSQYQYNGRVMFQPWGAVGYSEGDFEYKDKPLFAIAANVERNIKAGATPDQPDPTKPPVYDVDRTVVGVDASFKYRGFSTMFEYFWRQNTPEEGTESDSKGFHMQAGYFVVPKTVEAAFRYAWWDPTDLKSSDARKEYGAGMGYFWAKHSMKLQADVRRLEDEAKAEGAGRKTTEFRIQSQFIF